MDADYNSSFLPQFLDNTRVLESITVHDYQFGQSMAFLNHAHDIKYFELKNHVLSPQFDDLFQFLGQQKNLQFLSIIQSNQEPHFTVFLEFLDKMIDAILVRKTVKHINLIVNINVESKASFKVMFYNIFYKLCNLPLTLNGISIENVLRDLKKIDDIVFGAEGNAIKLEADKFLTDY